MNVDENTEWTWINVIDDERWNNTKPWANVYLMAHDLAAPLVQPSCLSLSYLIFASPVSTWGQDAQAYGAMINQLQAGVFQAWLSQQ
jgi:hypothetical protein